MFDARSVLRFAIRGIAVGVVVALGAFLALAVFVPWRWPVNFAVTSVLMFCTYCLGRVHEADISTRPTHTISSLPPARARRRSDG